MAFKAHVFGCRLGTIRPSPPSLQTQNREAAQTHCVMLKCPIWASSPLEPRPSVPLTRTSVGRVCRCECLPGGPLACCCVLQQHSCQASHPCPKPSLRLLRDQTLLVQRDAERDSASSAVLAWSMTHPWCPGSVPTRRWNRSRLARCSFWEVFLGRAAGRRMVFARAMAASLATASLASVTGGSTSLTWMRQQQINACI